MPSVKFGEEKIASLSDFKCKCHLQKSPSKLGPVIIYPTAFIVPTKARVDGENVWIRRQIALLKESWATEGIAGAILGNQS